MISPRVTQTIAPTAVPVAPFDLVLIGGTVIDGTGAAPIPNAAIAIRGERIVAVGRADQVVIPPGTPTRDVRGMTVLPGFINAHAHTHSLQIEQLKDWPRAGVTTVRDLQGPRDTIIARRAAIAVSGETASETAASLTRPRCKSARRVGYFGDLEIQLMRLDVSVDAQCKISPQTFRAGFRGTGLLHCPLIPGRAC